MDSTQIKGVITEQKCFLKCLEYGFNISKPIFDNTRYDFILDTGRKLLKIQIKTSRWNVKHTVFKFNCYSQHSIGKCNKRMKYTNKEIDYFMTECDGKFYLFPAPEEGISEKSLRVIPTKSNQAKNVSFASDYLFDEVVKRF